MWIQNSTGAPGRFCRFTSRIAGRWILRFFPSHRNKVVSPAPESRRINSSVVPSGNTSPVVSMGARQVAPPFSSFGCGILAINLIVRPVHLRCDAQNERERHLEHHCWELKRIQKNLVPHGVGTNQHSGTTTITFLWPEMVSLRDWSPANLVLSRRTTRGVRWLWQERRRCRYFGPSFL